VPKLPKTGVPGLYELVRKDGRKAYRIDIAWLDPKTGEKKRYQEQLPHGIGKTAAKERARLLLAEGKAGRFDPRRKLREALTSI